MNKQYFLLIILQFCMQLTFCQLQSFDTIPTDIMSDGRLSESELFNFFSSYSNGGDLEKIKVIIPIYINEALEEGVNSDIAFAQMILETGYLKYGGIVVKEQNNFCGLGATSKKNKGHWFGNEVDGIRAHIQHLKAYATTDSLKNDLIDPRYSLVQKGESPTIFGLAGTWAADKNYSDKLVKLLKKMYSFKLENKDIVLLSD